MPRRITLLDGRRRATRLQILMVVTSRDRVGDTGPKTGFSLEEFTAAYYVFKDAGAEITLASPNGGHPPIDPRSDGSADQSGTVKRFKGDSEARTALADTLWLDQVAPEDFDAVFYVGGHGVLWDLAEDPISQTIICALLTRDRPVALVDHGPAALRRA